MGSASGLPGPPSQQRLGTWHLAPCMSSTGLALWPSRRQAPPFPVAGVVSLSQCGGVGVRGGHLPGVQAGPIRQYILGSQQLLRGEASSALLPACGSWQTWRSPSVASARHHPDKLWEGTGAGGDSGNQNQQRTLWPGPLLITPASRLCCPPPPHSIFVRQLWELPVCKSDPTNIPTAPP